MADETLATRNESTGFTDTGSHYRFSFAKQLTDDDIESGKIIIKLDPYRIAEIYDMKDFALMTILKKTLCAGNRGHKDLKQDLLDIITAAKRRIEMLDEDDG